MLDVAVFLCGAAVMILEIVGARILAPYLGTSIVVWTGLIGVILASLSIGYAWGGRVADRRPEPGLLSALIALAAAAVALTALLLVELVLKALNVRCKRMSKALLRSESKAVFMLR